MLRLSFLATTSSVHPTGMEARKAVDWARERLALAFKIPKEGVTFTASGTEANNLALKGSLVKQGKIKGELCISPIEHPSILEVANWFEALGGKVQVLAIEPNTGLIDEEGLKAAINENTRLVSIQQVNSETGILQDIPRLSKIIAAANRKTLFHVDGVQALGKLKIERGLYGADMYSISAHKIGGLKGAGALLRSSKINIEPQMLGGGQERGLRSGTENVLAIWAFGMAMEKALAKLDKFEAMNAEIKERMAVVTAEIKAKFPELELLTFPEKVPHIQNLKHPHLPGEVLVHHLAEQGYLVIKYLFFQLY